MAFKNTNHLTIKQQRFCDAWLQTGNGLKAYRAAYKNKCSNKAAAVEASKTLRKPYVKLYIEKRQAEMQKKSNVDQDWLLDRYVMLCDYIITDFFYDDGHLKPLSDMPEETLYAIQGLVVYTTGHAKDSETEIRKFKLPDKKSALDSIAKMLGLMIDRKKVQSEVGVKHKLSPHIQAKMDAVYGRKK